MPYADTASLPAAVKTALPTARLRTAWLKAFNAAFAEYKDEKRAFATAWSTIGEIATKGKDGKWTVKAGKEKPAKKSADVMLSAEVKKLDEEQRVVWGWASVIEEGGQVVIDKQGDVIDEAELVAAAHGFMRDARLAKAMHDGDGIGEVVESVVLTKGLQQALGIDLGKVGWLIGMHVADDAAWQSFRSGEFTGFSIGGSAVREEMADG